MLASLKILVSSAGTATVQLPDGSTFTGTFHNNDPTKPKEGRRVLTSGEIHEGTFAYEPSIKGYRIVKGTIQAKTITYTGNFVTAPQLFIKEGSAITNDKKVELHGEFDPQTLTLHHGTKIDYRVNVISKGFFIKGHDGQSRLAIGRTENQGKFAFEGIHNPTDGTWVEGVQYHPDGRLIVGRFHGQRSLIYGTTWSGNVLQEPAGQTYYHGLRRVLSMSLLEGYLITFTKAIADKTTFPYGAGVTDVNELDVPVFPELNFVVLPSRVLTLEQATELLAQNSIITTKGLDAAKEFPIPSTADLIRRITGTIATVAYQGTFSNKPYALRSGVKVSNSRGIGYLGSPGSVERIETGIFVDRRIGYTIGMTMSNDLKTLKTTTNEGVMNPWTNHILHGYQANADASVELATVERPHPTLTLRRGASSIQAIGACAGSEWVELVLNCGASTYRPLVSQWISIFRLAAMEAADAQFRKRTSYVVPGKALDLLRIALGDTSIEEVTAAVSDQLELSWEENVSLERAFLRSDNFCVLRGAAGTRRATFTNIGSEMDLQGVMSDVPDFFGFTGVVSIRSPKTGVPLLYYRMPVRLVTGMAEHAAALPAACVPPPSVEGSPVAFPVLPFLWCLHDDSNGALVGTLGFYESWALEAALLLNAKCHDAGTPREELMKELRHCAVNDWGYEDVALPETSSWEHRRTAVAASLRACRFTRPLGVYLTADAPPSLSSHATLGVYTIAPGATVSLFPHRIDLDGLHTFSLRRTPLTAREMTCLPFYGSAFVGMNKDRLHFGTPGIDDIDVPVASLDRVGVDEAVEAMTSIAYLHGAVAFFTTADGGCGCDDDLLSSSMTLVSGGVLTGPRTARTNTVTGCSDPSRARTVNADLARKSRQVANTIDTAILRCPFQATAASTMAALVAEIESQPAATSGEADGERRPSMWSPRRGKDLAAGSGNPSALSEMMSMSFFGPSTEGMVKQALRKSPPRHSADAGPAAAPESSSTTSGAITVRFAAPSESALTAVLHDALRWLVGMERVAVPAEWTSMERNNSDLAGVSREESTLDSGLMAESEESAASILDRPAPGNVLTGAALASIEAAAAGIVLPTGLDVPLGTNNLLVFVRPGTPEYKSVTACFSQSSFVLPIICIQRVQNRELWEKYTMQMRQIGKENGGDANEILWMKHGTRGTPPLTICTTGFDHRYCEKGMYGRATYFAHSSHYSHLYRHDLNSSPKLPNGNTAGQMILARVVRGRIDTRTKSDAEMKHPASGCHSVEGPVTTNGLSAVMIYDLHQAYPAYVITYQVPPKDQNTHAKPMSAVASKPAAKPAAAKPVGKKP